MKPQNTKLLRSALIGNAIFSAVSAIILFVFPEKVGSVIGTTYYFLLSGIGLGLGVFSVDLFHQASRRRMQTWRALYASLGDGLWVLGTLILLVWFPDAVSEQGGTLLIAIGVIVGLFGFFQLLGAGEAHRIKGSKFYRHCVAVPVPSKTTKMWDVISDLPGISKYFPALRSSVIRDGMKSQVGATRQCEDLKGKRWAEKCTKFEVGKRIEMEFLCQEEDFPYPASEMIGGWELIEISDKVIEVRIWWELRPNPFFMAPLIMPLLGLKADIDFPPIVLRMADCENVSENIMSVVGRILMPTPSC